jgi:hypothetical protein
LFRRNILLSKKEQFRMQYKLHISELLEQPLSRNPNAVPTAWPRPPGQITPKAFRIPVKLVTVACGCAVKRRENLFF